MAAPSPDQIETLSADLVPFFGDPNTSMMVVKVIDVIRETQPTTDGMQIEVGTVKLDVLEVLHSNVLNRGGSIEVPFKRFADPAIRVRNHFDMWNVIDLTPGAAWLMAGRLISAPNSVMGSAAIKIETFNGVEVNAARQCYVIENIKGQPEKIFALLENALTSKTNLLRFYALDLLGRRALYGRAQGAEMIAKAIIGSGNSDADDKLDLGSYLTRQYFFAGDLKGDEANPKIIGALAYGLVSEVDPERRSEWMNYLASCVLSELSPKQDEDRALRSVLIRKVQSPLPTQVIDALNALARQADVTEQERIMELQSVWRDSI